MKTEIKATATIMVTIGKQKVELSMDEAKKLVEQLEPFVGVKTRIEYVPVETRPSRWDKLPEAPVWPHLPDVICRVS